MKLTPAQYTVYIFGNAGKVSKIIGKSRTAVVCWLRKGLVPSQHMPKLIKAARRKGYDFTPNDLVFGRNVSSTELAKVHFKK